MRINGFDIDLSKCAFPLKPTGSVKWAYTSLWRTPSRPGHNGVDIGSSHYPVYETCYGWPQPAIMSGELYYRYDDRSGHNWNIRTPYGTFCGCHIQKPADNRSRRVQVGEIVGLTGTSGNVAAHSHLIWFLPNGNDTNPVPLLDAIAAYKWDNHESLPIEPHKEDEEEMPSLMINENTGEVFLVAGNTKHYIKDESIPAEKIIEGLITGGVADLRNLNRAAYLEGLGRV